MRGFPELEVVHVKNTPARPVPVLGLAANHYETLVKSVNLARPLCLNADGQPGLTQYATLFSEIFLFFLKNPTLRLATALVNKRCVCLSAIDSEAVAQTSFLRSRF